MPVVLRDDRLEQIDAEYRERNRIVAGLLEDVATETESLGWGWDRDRDGIGISEVLRMLKERAEGESL